MSLSMMLKSVKTRNTMSCSNDGSSVYLPSGMRGAQMNPWRAGMSRGDPLVASGSQISASVDS